MRLRLVYIIPFVLICIGVTGCSRSIQTDASIKEERSSSNETGPVLAKAVVRSDDGTPVGNRTFHLVTISRDDKGGMNRLEQLYGFTGDTDANGNLNFSVPREKISGVSELSFGLNSSNPYAGPMIIRRKDAKEILTFKADAKTKTVDLGEVVVLLR